MNAMAIRYGWGRPQPLPTDFIFAATHVERTTIADKKEGVSLPHMGTGYGASSSMGYASPAYFVFTMTRDGDMRITVSKKVYNLLRIGDSIVVQYQRGRWTGALKGKIAR
ncbi:MAG: hypothetical protein AAB597_01405 [Patescibacteria group bacterium]